MAPKRKSVSKNSTVMSVVSALAETEALPADFRELLGKTLPTVLNTNKADRHEFEAEIVEKAAESLTIAQKAVEAEHAAALTKQSEMVSPQERAKRDGAKKDAELKQKEAQDLVVTCDTSKKEADKGVADADSAVKAAQKEERDAEKVAQKTGATKSSLTEGITVDFASLIGGTFAKSSAKKKAVSAVVKLGKAHGVGNTLSQAFTLACNTDVDKRSAFETTTFETVKGKLDAALVEVSKQLEDETAVVEQKKAATAAAKDSLAGAEGALKEAEAKLAAAKDALKEAKKALSQAVTFRYKVWGEMKSACDAQDELAEALKKFKEVIWPAFEELKEKAPPPPPPVEEAPVEAEEPPEKKQRTEAEANAD